MTKGILALLLVATGLIGYPLTKKGVELYNSNPLSYQLINPAVQDTILRIMPEMLVEDRPKNSTVRNTLILEGRNTVTFRGVVSSETVSVAMKEITALSRLLSKKDPIYLVLDTPGGSVFDGAEFIDFLEGVPQEVKTVTIFAASMGFQIAQNNPGERLIARNGVLMSHRATGGVDGQFNGELESRYKMIKRKIDFLDVAVAKRMGISYEDYQRRIINEYWIHGFDATEQKLADQMVLIQCGPTLVGTTDMTVQTFFGPINLKFDKCPLLREPVAVSFSQVREDAQPYVKGVINLLFTNQSRFIKDIINTDKYYKLFK